ncbi:ComEC/Rec2 family competence protein [Thalassotalea ponticola]|uniref:ComEC/Rec2 family competence protein n=1 Tax=Thalassotalea ponticola TaxID=1523392 RepID=UPI0025B4BBB9|nr:ComEC/Rec2 family competence protein [Thalassotalea ponticola]MDN3652622.1 ComEC/Rec2 family competence protein [Thalassotalea ponticola]
MERWLLCFLTGGVIACLIPANVGIFYLLALYLSSVVVLFLLSKLVFALSSRQISYLVIAFSLGFSYLLYNAIVYQSLRGNSLNQSPNHSLTNEKEGGASALITQLASFRFYPPITANPYPNPVHVRAEVLSLIPSSESLDNAGDKSTETRLTAAANRGVKVTLAIDVIDQHPLTKPIIARLHFNSILLPLARQGDGSRQGLVAISQGDRLTLQVKLKPAHGFANLGSFSYARWLKHHGIHFTGYVKQMENHRLDWASNAGSAGSIVRDGQDDAYADDYGLDDWNQVIVQSPSKRQQVQHRLTLAFNHGDTPIAPELKALLLALSIADKSQVSDEQWQLLRDTGTAHLFAISGLHLSLIGTLGFVLGRLCLYLITSYRLLSCYGYYLPLLSSIILATVYAYLAGFAIPTVRALAMLVVLVVLSLLKRPFMPLRYVLLSTFVVILIEPFALFDSSFYLSLLAVVVIIYGLFYFAHRMRHHSALRRWFIALVLVQVLVSLVALPLSLLLFGQASLVSPIANVVVVPVMSMTVIPLCLLATLTSALSVPLAHAIFELSAHLMQACLWYLTTLVTHWGSALNLTNLGASLQAALLLLSATALFSWLLPLDTKAKVKMLVISVSAFLVIPATLSSLIQQLSAELSLTSAKESGDNDARQPSPIQPLALKTSATEQTPWQLVVFDVGHGLAVLIEPNQRAVLYDTGASYKSGFNFVDAVIIPYLRFKSITHLDYTLISHGDNDHAGGLSALIDARLTGALITNISAIDRYIEQGDMVSALKSNLKPNLKPKLKPTPTPTPQLQSHLKTVKPAQLANQHHKALNANRANTVLHYGCYAGQTMRWQGLTISTLSPQRAEGDKNDDSCVWLVTDNHHKVLIPGDISERIEQQLLARLDTDFSVVIAPHHGSKTSSSQAFVEQLQSQYVVYSSGFLNRWQMPVSKVQARYQQAGTAAFNTAVDGMVVFQFLPSGDLPDKRIEVFTYRQHLRPLWPFN